MPASAELHCVGAGGISIGEATPPAEHRRLPDRVRGGRLRRWVTGRHRRGAPSVPVLDLRPGALGGSVAGHVRRHPTGHGGGCGHRGSGGRAVCFSGSAIAAPALGPERRTRPRGKHRPPCSLLTNAWKGACKIARSMSLVCRPFPNS